MRAFASSSLNCLGVGIAKARPVSLPLEAGEVGALGKEVLVGLLQILERVLQRVHGRIGQPGRLRPIAPGRQVLGHGHVADELAACLVVGLLQCQRLVEDEPAGTSEAAHAALLLAVWHQLELKGLLALHGLKITGESKNASQAAIPALKRPGLSGGGNGSGVAAYAAR